MTWSSEGGTPGTKISHYCTGFTLYQRLRTNSQERIKVLGLRGLTAVGLWWWSEGVV